MITTEYLKKVNFFIKRSAILEGNKLLGIEDVLLPRPMLTAQEGELQLVIQTNDKYSLENHTKFLEKLDKIFDGKAVVSVFAKDDIKNAIEQGIGMTCIYQDFLQSAIPISSLKEDQSLESQWRVYENRLIATATSKSPVASLMKRSGEPLAKRDHDEIVGKVTFDFS